MGEVYRAVDTRMYRRPVALKLLSEAMGADPRALSRFDQEIETAANLRHPNIVQIYDRGEHEGRRYFAMELLEGRDLSDVIKERELRPLDARLDIIVQLCDALDYAHAHGVVHRDIKPANILVITRGATDHVKLVDFGIAHVARADRTRTVVQPGTMLYMSPEQLQDEVVTPRSDLFSLGIVAYELGTGVHPFKARTEYLTSTNIMFEKQAPLRSVEPTAPEALETLLDRLLEKHGESRPASAAEVGAELKAIVRQLRAGASDSDPVSFGNLDEMTGSMVGRIVHWAKGKEAAGAIREALEGYKRALLLAPDAPWLHARIARTEEQLQQSSTRDVQPEDDLGLRTSSRNRHREAFVRDHLVDAHAALDTGDLDRASSIAAVILRQYPDEPQALALMDRIVMITDRELPVQSYRQALRTAREALAQGDIEAAQRSREAAVAIWPDDDEVITLGREIEKLRQVELGKAMMICDDVLGRAAGGTLDDDAASAEVARALDALRRCEEMGAPAALAGLKREALDRVLEDSRARVEERRAEVKQEQARDRERAHEERRVEPDEPDAGTHADEAARARRVAQKRRFLIGGGAIVLAAAALVLWQAYAGKPQGAPEPKTNAPPAPVDTGRAKLEPPKPESHVDRVEVVPPPPQPPQQPQVDQDLERKLAAIGSDLRFAGKAPAGPIESIDDALGRADHGIALVAELRKSNPSEPRTQTLLRELQATRTVLLGRRATLLQRASAEERPKDHATPDAAAERGVVQRVEPPPVPPPSPPRTPPVASRQDVDAVFDEARRQHLSSPAGVAARIALDRQGLEKLARSGEQDWTPAKTAEIQSDLDASLVWRLFHTFRDALVARNTEAILELYPRYPSAKAIAELRDFQYSFDIVDLNVAAKTASVRETTRGHQKPDFWEAPRTATRKYLLDRRADGSWFIVSVTLVR
jgi:serine/threonine protein kinase